MAVSSHPQLIARTRYVPRARRIVRWLLTVVSAILTTWMAAQPAGAVDFNAAQNATQFIGTPSWASEAYATDAFMQYGMRGPSSVAIDGSGSVYVTETSNNRALRWNASPAADGEAFTNVFGKSNASKTSWRRTCSAQGSIDPTDVSVAGDGAGARVVLSQDYGRRVTLYEGEPTADNAAAVRVLGQPDLTTCTQNFGGSGSPNFTPTRSSMSRPTGVWTDGTKIAVADIDNNRVMLWNAWPGSDGVAAAVILGQPDGTSKLADNPAVGNQGWLQSPTGVFWDGTYLYVADYSNHRVLVWQGWPTTDGQLANYVLGQPNFGGTGGTCSATRLNVPWSIFARGSGGTHEIFIADTGNSRVARILGWDALAPGSKSGAAFTNAIGQANLTTCTANRNAVPAANSLFEPREVEVDASNRLWVADTDNNRVLRFDTLTGDPSASRVLGHAGAGAMTTTVPYDAVNQWTGNRNGDNLGAVVNGDSVALAPDGTLIASSANDSAVVQWTGGPATDNAAVDLRVGQANRFVAGKNAHNNTTSQTSLHSPRGVWTDGTRLAVVDKQNDRVVVWTTMPSSDTDPPDYVLGQTTWTGNSQATAINRLNDPYDVTSDGIDLYVSDNGNNRIMVWRNFWLTPSDGKNASIVLAQPDFTTGTGGLPASSTTLDDPYEIDIKQDTLVVADRGHDRVLVWHAASTLATNAPATGVVGQVDLNTAAGATETNNVVAVSNAGNAIIAGPDCDLRWFDPLPAPGGAMLSGSRIGTNCIAGTPTQSSHYQIGSIASSRGRVWVSSSGDARLKRWDDTRAPTLTAGPTATVRCDGTVTITWTTSESTTTEIGWDTVTRAWGAYANTSIDTSLSGLTHTYDLSFATPGTRYARVRAVDWTSGGLAPNAPVVSGEISFTVPPTCPAPTTMFGDDANAQAGFGRANPSATNAPPILSTTFHTSWMNAAGVTMDRREAGTWTSPPEHAGGLWHFDGATTADPNSQHAGSGVWTGAPTYAAGRFGQALNTNATRYVTVPHDAAITKSNDFTVDAWFNTTTIANTPFPVIVLKSDNGCSGGDRCNYQISFDRATTRICALLRTTLGVQRAICVDATAVLDGTWHHAAMVTTAANQLLFYVDGVLVGGPLAMGAAARTGADPLGIGRTPVGGEAFVGLIDEVRFSPRAYSAAEILGYYRTKRPHAQQLWTSASTALGANCVTATRCEDQAYAGVADIMRPGARYWQRTRFNTLTNDYWTDWGNDWLEVNATDSINVTVGSTIGLGTQLPGSDAFGTSTVQVTSNSPGGYQLLAHDESDTWALERTPATDTIADRQDGATPPALWNAGIAGYFGITVRDATNGRLPKWGAGTAWPETDVTNNLYTGLENTTDVLLHERTTYNLATDTILVTSRANTAITDLAGSYDGIITLTAIANA